MKHKLKRIFEKFIWWSGVITIGIVFGLGIQLVLAWIEPSVAPPGGNVEAPVNISGDDQYKIGPLGIGGLLALWGGFWLDNNGQDVSGKVLTADAAGFGSWQTGGGSGGVLSYTYYCFSDSSFGTPVCTDAGGTQGFCPSGYTQKLALGSWGRCYNSQSDYHSDYFIPPGGSCGTVCGYNIGGNYVGSAYICAKVISEGWYVPSDVKTTTATHDGNFGGYKAMHDWIQSDAAECKGYHVCDSSEITRYYQMHPTPAAGPPAFYNTGYGSYYPNAYGHEHDCDGWTAGFGIVTTSGWYGNFPSYAGCGDSKVMCCK